jgi:hypothetical protein
MSDVLALTPEDSAQSHSAAPVTVYASSSSDVDIEKQRSSNTSEDVIHDHVDIQYAERQFADLKRRYSNLSRVASATSHRSRLRSEKGHRAATSDIEESDDEFDLEDVLRDRHKREMEHDIKPKHLGILRKRGVN